MVPSPLFTSHRVARLDGNSIRRGRAPGQRGACVGIHRDCRVSVSATWPGGGVEAVWHYLVLFLLLIVCALLLPSPSIRSFHLLVASSPSHFSFHFSLSWSRYVSPTDLASGRRPGAGSSAGGSGTGGGSFNSGSASAGNRRYLPSPSGSGAGGHPSRSGQNMMGTMGAMGNMPFAMQQQLAGDAYAVAASVPALAGHVVGAMAMPDASGQV